MTLGSIKLSATVMLATAVVVGMRSQVRAADPAPAPTPAPAPVTDFAAPADFTLEQRIYLQTDPMTDEQRLLATELREAGYTGYLDRNDIQFSGHAQVGYTYNFMRPPGRLNAFGRQFDDKSEDPRLDQIDLWVRRNALISPDQYDMGFGLEVMYGSDMKFIHANGLNAYGSGLPPTGQPDPDEQIDLFQAYGTLNTPIGNGLLFTFGKFATPWGVEHVNSSLNTVYSHSYIFSLSTPKSLTGVTARYTFNDQWWGMGGLVVGWDQAIDDNNDMVTFVGQAGYKHNEQWDFLFSAIVGPEREDNRSDYRWMIDATAKWKLSHKWDVAFEGVAGYEPDVGTEFTDVENPPGSGFVQRQFLFTGEDAFWFGVAAYSKHRLDAEGVWTMNLRGEYFFDPDGARFFPTEVSAVTVALDIVPWPEDRYGRGLLIRPEFRWDYAIDDVFDGGSRNTQMTLAVGLMYKF